MFWLVFALCTFLNLSTATSNVCVTCAVLSLRLVTCNDNQQVNVLVDSTRRARLTDFGLSNILHGTMSETATAQGRGTIRWMAPELLGADNTSGADSGADRPTKASDVYAVGMVLYEVELPFCASDLPDAMNDRFSPDGFLSTCIGTLP